MLRLNFLQYTILLKGNFRNFYGLAAECSSYLANKKMHWRD